MGSFYSGTKQKKFTTGSFLFFILGFLFGCVCFFFKTKISPASRPENFPWMPKQSLSSSTLSLQMHFPSNFCSVQIWWAIHELNASQCELIVSSLQYIGFPGCSDFFHGSVCLLFFTWYFMTIYIIFVLTHLATMANVVFFVSGKYFFKIN